MVARFSWCDDHLFPIFWLVTDVSYCDNGHQLLSLVSSSNVRSFLSVALLPPSDTRCYMNGE
jgi:hypothetical protein